MGSKRFCDDWRGEMTLQSQNVAAIDFLALLLSRRQLDRGLVRHTRVLIDRITGEAFSISDSEIHRLGSLVMR